jgi:hypothetical protein
MYMKSLPEKLNYKGQERIALINADESFTGQLSSVLNDIRIDKEIDPRFPYTFVIIFVKTVKEVEHFTPIVLHNLTADGVLWFCFPKKTSKKANADLDRDHGWKALNDSCFFGIRLIAMDDDWSAMRFRNSKFIKSSKISTCS